MRSSHKSPTNGRLTTPQSEHALVEAAFTRISAYPGVRVCCNVGLLGRCIDMVFVRNGRVYTVEFKLHDLRRAIGQARDHRLGCDFAYICMPDRRLSKSSRAMMMDAGVGLFFYCAEGTWPFTTVQKAPRSDETWSVARSQLLRYLMERDKAES